MDVHSPFISHSHGKMIGSFPVPMVVYTSGLPGHCCDESDKVYPNHMMVVVAACFSHEEKLNHQYLSVFKQFSIKFVAYPVMYLCHGQDLGQIPVLGDDHQFMNMFGLYTHYGLS